MAKSIELTYFPNATANCSNCNSTYRIGMTVEKITLEICGNCHPFYTGQETLIDTAGRIEKFQARTARADGGQVAKKAKTKARKFRQTLADLNDLGESQEAQNEEVEAKAKVKPSKAAKAEPVEEVVPTEASPEEPTTSDEEVITPTEELVESIPESQE